MLILNLRAQRSAEKEKEEEGKEKDVKDVEENGRR